MQDQVQIYIDQCIRIGLLTSKKLRKYPLRSANLAVFVKVYALFAKLPFVLDVSNLNNFDEYKLYLTEDGLAWLIHQFKQYSLSFLRTTFQFVFSNLKDLKDIDTYEGLNNFKGITGVNYKAGTKNKALLIRQVGVRKLEYEFNTLVEARKEVLSLTRYYPLTQFTLYLIGKTKKGVYYKQKVPLVLESNRRGVPVNLPHLKGKV
jgi:hypothetical protein